MRSTGFTVGVLSASCVLVIVGLILTLTELNEFKQQPTEKTWQPKPDIETPLDTGDDIEGAGASRKRLFAAAPSDAIGIVVMDMQKINATGIFKQGNAGFSLSGTKNLPIEPEELGETVIFAQPGTGGGESVLTGLSTHTADAQALEQALSDAAENTTAVEELNAHRLAQDEFVALKGDDLILFASTPQDLESLIRRQDAGDGRLPSKLQSTIAPYQNSAIHFAATEIRSLKNTMSGKVPVNKVPQGIDQAAGRVDLAGSNMDVEVKVTFLESTKAREAADQIKTQLEQAAPAISQMIKNAQNDTQKQAFKTIKDMMDSLQVNAVGSDLALSLQANLDELKAEGLMQAMFSGAMGNMGGGGTPPNPGTR